MNNDRSDDSDDSEGYSEKIKLGETVDEQMNMKIAFKDENFVRKYEVVKTIKTYWKGKIYEWETYDITKKTKGNGNDKS